MRRLGCFNGYGAPQFNAPGRVTAGSRRGSEAIVPPRTNAVLPLLDKWMRQTVANPAFQRGFGISGSIDRQIDISRQQRCLGRIRCRLAGSRS
jgi:hypothetical protein